MLRPDVLSGMEQAYNFSAGWINTGNVRAFIAVAMNAAQSQIIWLCYAAVLTGNDVVNLKRGRRCRRRQMTIFTPVSSPKGDLTDKMGVGQWLLQRLPQNTTSPGLHDAEKVIHMNIAVKLLCFLGVQSALPSQLGQLVDPRDVLLFEPYG